MTVEVRPAADFEDVAAVIGPRRPGASVCFCLSHRIPFGENRARLTSALIEGAVALARAEGAPVLEAYPVDSGGQRVHSTMAFVGLVPWFERAGFVRAASTTSTLDGFPRVLMRRDLR